MRADRARLDFLPDGSVQGVYTEAIDLGLLGRLKIERASSIEFDNTRQVWRVFDRKGRGVFSSASRSACLRWEEEHINEQMNHAVGE